MGIGLRAVQSQKVSQGLVQQAAILQMSSPELTSYIEEIALENPMAEIEEKHDMDCEKEKLDRLEWLAEFDEQNRFYYQSERDADQGDIFNVSTYETNQLEDLLKMQIIGCVNSEEEKEIIEYLIRCLDRRGYFTDSVEDISVHFGIPGEKIRHCLNILKSLEPAGIGAENLSECLMIQLMRLGNSREYEAEKIIIENYLELMGKNKLHEIAKRLNVSVQRVHEAAAVIKNLNPKPANGYGHLENIHYVKPDVTVDFCPEGLKIMVEETSLPELRINESYMRLLRSGECSDDVGKYIAGKIKQIEQIHGFLLSNIYDCEEIRYRYDGYVRHEFNGLGGISFRLVKGDVKLAEDLELIHLPGHTPGTMGLVVRTEGFGTAVFPSDAVYNAANYGPPAMLPGMCACPKEFGESIEKCRKIAEQEKGAVFFSHDVKAYQTYKKSPEWYE